MKQEKINILFCIEYLDAGGTEKQLISLINGLKKLKYQPYLCCIRTSIIYGGRKEEALDLFKNIECPKIQLNFDSFRNISSLLDLLKLIKFIRKNKVDIIQTYFQDPSVFGLIAGRLCGVKKVIACFRDMGFWREQERDLKMKMTYKLCTGYIANSFAVKDYYRKVYNLRKDKFTVIYNGVDVEKITKNRRNEKEFINYFTVGIIANLNRKVKRVDIFLKAAEYVNKRMSGIKFMVIGDGELKEELIKLSKELSIDGIVEFIGRVKDIENYLTKIDIGIISSDSEGFSNAILEKMAARIPVIATDVGGNKEIIKNNFNGYLVPKGDFKAIGEKIINLIKDKEIFIKFQCNGEKTVLENYSMEKCIEKHEIYYETILNRKNQ